MTTLESQNAVGPPPSRRPRIIGLLKKLGPGLITGASDDDPSGIATYSQAGAQFGYGLLWTQLFSLPLMSAIQEISARIGRVTGRGIAGNIRRTYSKWVLYPVILLVVVANTINLGADIGAVGDAVHLLVGGPALLYAALFALLSLGMECFLCYRRYSEYLKWLTVVLFAYVGAAIAAHVPWRQAMHATFLPHLSVSRDYIATFIAVLGTTISPYLFFWQASMETEEIRNDPHRQPLRKELKNKPGKVRGVLSRIRWDTYVGMTFANLVSYCIIVTAAAALNGHGITDVQTSQQAAQALAPIAGRAASIIFALGIIGTGMLAVPVLAGSAAYAVGEALHWPTGLDRKPLDAKGFYGVVSIATVIGLAINFTHWIDPIKALFWSAVINGVVAVPVMVMLMLMIRSRKVMGEFSRVSKGLRMMGWLATAVMAAASVGLFVTWKQ